jgi:hypothetical protein
MQRHRTLVRAHREPRSELRDFASAGKRMLITEYSTATSR